MEQTLQYIAVALIVFIAVLYLVRRYIWRGSSKRKSDLCEGCALKDNCDKSCKQKGNSSCGCC